MSCETENKQIGDHEYAVTQWPAQKALLMKFKLAKMFGPVFSILVPMLPDSKKQKADDQKELEAFASAFEKLFATNSPEELVQLLKDCIVGSFRNGERITETTFDQIFSGDQLNETYKVFIFVVKVNYANLFKGQLADKLLASVKEKL